MPITQMLQFPYGGSAGGGVFSTYVTTEYTVPRGVRKLRINWLIGAGGGCKL